MPTGITPPSSFQPGRGSGPPWRRASGEAQARPGLGNRGSERRTPAAPQAHHEATRTAADARPAQAPEGGETMPAPPVRSRPHAPARRTRVAPPQGEGQRREGAGSGGPACPAPASACASRAPGAAHPPPPPAGRRGPRRRPRPCSARRPASGCSWRGRRGEGSGRFPRRSPLRSVRAREEARRAGEGGSGDHGKRGGRGRHREPERSARAAAPSRFSRRPESALAAAGGRPPEPASAGARPAPARGLRGNAQPIPAAHCGLAPAPAPAGRGPGSGLCLPSSARASPRLVPTRLSAPTVPSFSPDASVNFDELAQRTFLKGAARVWVELEVTPRALHPQPGRRRGSRVHAQMWRCMLS